jgi:putative hemolysin
MTVNNVITAMEALIAPIPKSVLQAEINTLSKEYLLFIRGDFEVYLTPATHIPNLLKEIGRLRELTFRAVGEGTGKTMDVDHYDKYYQNLFIWDAKSQRIVGGYRIGPGENIFETYGVKGFYIRSLFKIKKGFYKTLQESVELGRSYIVPDYQKKPFPLFLLWRGILTFLNQNPNYRYLIGPVSISKTYSDISKSMIIAFVKRYCYDAKNARYFEARTPYKPIVHEIDVEEKITQFNGQLKNLESFLESIEENNIRVPIMLKQYSRQNAKFISFNIDPNFSNALDGLMILDLKNVPEETLALLNEK